MATKFTGKIGFDGKLVMLDRSLLEEWIKQHAGKHVELTIKVQRKQRSTLQNAYYHAVVVKMVCEGLRDLGHEIDEDLTHEFLKGKFNSENVVGNDGVVESIPRSTTEMNTVEMMDYVAKIQVWAAEFLGIVIPDPNQQMTIDMAS